MTHTAPATQPTGFWARLQKRWGVSTRDMVVILIVFAIVGTSVLKISSVVVNALVPPDAPRWQWWLVKILVVVPIYEVLLLAVGILFGQGRFFYGKQKRLLLFLTRPFRRPRA